MAQKPSAYPHGKRFSYARKEAAHRKMGGFTSLRTLGQMHRTHSLGLNVNEHKACSPHAVSAADKLLDALLSAIAHEPAKATTK